ncbi:MAG: DUF305 domain-containing protein [Candidatus Levyibacteriota bacterium]
MKQSIIYGIAGLLIGVLVTGFVMANQNKSNTTMSHENMKMSTDNSMTMDAMTAGLREKSGDDFDQTFISEMIAHHQGAIDMAKLAQKNAKHEELKNLAKDIITAQTKEIKEMEQWQEEWGYKQ